LSEAKDRNAELARRVAESEEQGTGAPNSADQSDPENYHRRYELALDDVRELKARNQALEEQLRQAWAGASQAGTSGGGGLDWESQKRRMLATLESECEEGEDGASRRARRLQIEEVIRVTDQALAAKDREIAEMRQLLENQSRNLGSVAVGAAALGEVLDGDALIREERENLRRLQAEWEEKLRQAEIDVSIERAKIARERAQLEEKIRAQGEHPDQPQAPSGDSDKPDKPRRGRWLSRLGLKDKSSD
jgi:hypothetical protein